MEAVNKTKAVILYRVIQEWRRPVFERLAKQEGLELEVWHGCDFPGTKVVNTRKKLGFTNRQLLSIPINLGRLKNGLYLPFSPFLFFSLIRSKPDVVICEGASNFINNALAFAYCKLFGKKIVQWGLGEIRGQKRSGLRRVLDSVIVPIEKYSDACIAYSSIGKAYYKKLGHSEEDIFVAVNVVDTDKRQQALSSYKASDEFSTKESQRKTFDVVFVGALESNKSIEVLVQAFLNIAPKCPDMCLTIVGDGQYRAALETLAFPLIDDRITFTGKVTDGLEKVLAHSDIFVLPGLGGLAVSDALCHGVPVICGIGDGCEFDLVNDQNGILDDMLDQSRIERYLGELYATPERLKAMKASATETVKTYNISNYQKQIVRCIRHTTEK